MAIIRKKELKTMSNEILDKRLFEMRKELNSEKGLVATGGRSQNSGKIQELKRTIARILTIKHQKKINRNDKIKKDNSLVPDANSMGVKNRGEK